MKWIKALVYLVIIILLLQVIKVLVSQRAGIYAFPIATVFNALQWLLVMGFALVWIFSKLIGLFKVAAKKALLAAFAILIVLLVSLEWIAGYLLNHPQYIPERMLWSFQYYYDRYDTRIIQAEENASVYDSLLYYRLKPSNSYRYINREFNNIFNTNSKGIRDDEASLSAPQVICLGDSYGMGWGVEQQETYSQWLENKTGLKVLNAGVSSYGTARELMLLQQLDTSKLQYLIIQYCNNDRGENVSYVNNDYKLGISSKVRYDSMVAAGKVHFYFPGKYSLVLSQVFLKHEVNKIVPVFKQRAVRDIPFDNEKIHAEAFLKVLSHAPLNFEKIRVVVMVLNHYWAMKNNFLTALETMAAQSPYKERFAGNLRVIDCSDTLLRSDFYILDLHINASGHAKAGEKILQAMQAP